MKVTIFMRCDEWCTDLMFKQKRIESKQSKERTHNEWIYLIIFLSFFPRIKWMYFDCVTSNGAL